MSIKPIGWFAAALTLSFAVGNVRANSIYYNVDEQTLPNGPIELENAMGTYNAGQWILQGDAVNNTSQAFGDVKYVNEWVFDTSPAAFSFANSMTKWSGDGHTWKLDHPDGTLTMSDISPLLLNWTAGGPTATLASSDAPPYIDIGAIGANQTVHFSYKVDVDTEYPFNIIGSFVSQTQPVPEPSTLLLAGLAAVGICVAARRRLLAA